MAGHRPFNELIKGFSPERKARVVARVSQLKADMLLRELRQVRERSLEDLGREQDVASDQPGGSS